MEWKEYDPSWLVSLAEQQLPTEPWLQDALRACVKAAHDGTIVYFVDRMEGKFKQNITLFSSERGDVVLDLLQDGRIGALEILGSPFHQ